MALFSKRAKPVKLSRLEELQPLIESGRPVLLDFFQIGCAPCQVMDGIMNELAREYGASVHIVKVDVGRVAGAAQAFKVRSTPTFVLLGRAPRKKGKRDAPAAIEGRVTPRWRTSGLVKKDQLRRILESNGAVAADAT